MSRETKINKLSQEERKQLIERLLARQGGKSYISGEPIDLTTDEVEIDHIVSLNRGGLDDEINWGLVLKSENRSKGTKDLELMRLIYKYRKNKEKYLKEKGDFTFGDALNEIFPNRNPVKADISNGTVKISFKEGSESRRLEFPLIYDSGDKTICSFTGMLPFQILHHNSSINPRSIVDLEPMIEEFYNKNPQLQPSLAILNLDENGVGRISIFDGQHKAAAQLYARREELYTRVFINVEEGKIKNTNFRAHTSLAQIHFPQLISDKVGHDMFAEKFEPYLESVDLNSGSEAAFLKLQKEEGGGEEFKIYLQNWLKYRTLIGKNGEKHKILDFVETVSARSKKFPLSYETLNKTFFKFLFLNPSDDKLAVSQKFRDLELSNLKKLMEIYVEEVLDGKFDLNRGIFKLEEKLLEDPDSISDNHLIAYRMCKAPAMVIWIGELKKAVSRLLKSRNKYYKSRWGDERILWAEIDEQDWIVIRNMIIAIWQHQVWRQKENEEVLSSLRSTTQKDWKDILLDGRLPGREERYFSPLSDTKIYDWGVDLSAQN